MNSRLYPYIRSIPTKPSTFLHNLHLCQLSHISRSKLDDVTTILSHSRHLCRNDLEFDRWTLSSMRNRVVTRVCVFHITPIKLSVTQQRHRNSGTHCVKVYCTLMTAPMSKPWLNSCVCTSPGTSTPKTPQDLYPPCTLVPEQKLASKDG